jgi:hypothetical protein
LSVPLGADRNNEVGWSRGMGRCIAQGRVVPYRGEQRY